MSTYSRMTKNPKTGKYEKALWRKALQLQRDDYFAHHHYGVMFPDKTVYDPETTDLPTRDHLTSSEQEALKNLLSNA